MLVSTTTASSWLKTPTKISKSPFTWTDAHEMNWVTELLDAPFFARAETEKLFELMNSNRDVSGKTIGRFRIDFHRWEPRHAQILVFSFTPRPHA